MIPMLYRPSSWDNLEGWLDRPRGRGGRPRLRWVDAIAKDALTILNVRNWKTAAEERRKYSQAALSANMCSRTTDMETSKGQIKNM